VLAEAVGGGATRPRPGSRGAEALLLAARVAEATEPTARALGLWARGDALRLLAARARVARAGTPDAAAANFETLLRTRRRPRRCDNATELLEAEETYRGAGVDMVDARGRAVSVDAKALDLYNLSPGRPCAYLAGAGAR